MAFWSLARALATTFFCKRRSIVSINVLQNTAQSTPKTYLGLLALLEESLLGLLLSLLLLGEVLGGRDLLQSLLVNTGNVDALGGGDRVAGVDTAEGNAVDLEGTGNEENTLVEVLEEDDTLATETASEQDQDGTGLEALADLGGTQRLADLYAETKMSDSDLQVVPTISHFHSSDMKWVVALRRYGVCSGIKHGRVRIELDRLPPVLLNVVECPKRHNSNRPSAIVAFVRALQHTSVSSTLSRCSCRGILTFLGCDSSSTGYHF